MVLIPSVVNQLAQYVLLGMHVHPQPKRFNANVLLDIMLLLVRVLALFAQLENRVIYTVLVLSRAQAVITHWMVMVLVQLVQLGTIVLILMQLLRFLVLMVPIVPVELILAQPVLLATNVRTPGSPLLLNALLARLVLEVRRLAQVVWLATRALPQHLPR